MQFQIFEFRFPVDRGALEEMNQFLNQHRISGVDRSWGSRDGSPTLIFVVEYVGGTAAKPSEGARPGDTRASEEELKKRLGEMYPFFNELRDLRQKLAAERGIKIYNIFSNEQMAQLIEKRVTTREAMGAIPGVGEKKLEEFGEVFLAGLRRVFAQSEAQWVVAPSIE